MSLFAPDLYRSFAIGFVGGALILGAGAADGFAGMQNEMVGTANAAERSDADDSGVVVSDEFLIAPISEGADQ